MQSLSIVLLIAYIFYRSVIAFFLLSPIALFLLKKKRKDCNNKRLLELSLQFRELMNSIIATLHAGYSIENAFSKAYQDMSLLYGKKSYICIEISVIVKALKNNRNIEDLLDDFANRSGITDIKDFSEIFRIAKRSGGDMPAIMQQTVDVISDKMDVRRKISTIIASKKLEQSIMNLVPFGIVLYIEASSPGFFNSMYHCLSGILIMSVVLSVYIFAYVLAEKITDIKI